MRSLSGLDLTPQQKYVFSIRLTACILTALLTQSPASDHPGLPGAPSVRPSAESLENNVTGGKKAGKANKYDVERIGQRGIGRGVNLYSEKRERELGQKMAAAFDRNAKFVSDPVVNDYINRLGQKIVRNSDAEGPFTIKVIDSGDMPRAYSLPGGFLYVDSALILAADGEAELVSVMAHEIAHVAARHATRALTRRHLCNFVDSLALLTGPLGLALENVGAVTGPLTLKKFSRDAEYEADLLGIEYAYTAGYDPEASLAALEKLHALELQRNAIFAKVPGYRLASKVPFHNQIAKSFASHPLTEERMHRLQSEIPAFLPERKDYILDTDEFQEVKTRLLGSAGPVLRRHGSGGDDKNGPVLRRSNQYNSDARAFRTWDSVSK